MSCDKLGISMKEFVTKAIILSMEDLEDELDAVELGRARKEMV